jgi:polysaccharide pyruvyl transferase WcaK-like protein
LNDLNEKKEIRNIKFGTSINKSELKLMNQLAKKLHISKTELIVRAIKSYSEMIKKE